MTIIVAGICPRAKSAQNIEALTRKPILLLAISLLVTLSGCDADAQANAVVDVAETSLQGNTASNNAIAVTTRVASVSSKPAGEPQIGSCNWGECSWSIEQSRVTVHENENARLLKLSLLGGSSSMEEDAPITWNKEPHEVYVFCFADLPSVILPPSTESEFAQVDILDFVNGPPRAMEGAANLYVRVCHGNKVKWSNEGFAARYGYSAIEDGYEITSLSDPEDIFSEAESVVE